MDSSVERIVVTTRARGQNRVTGPRIAFMGYVRRVRAPMAVVESRKTPYGDESQREHIAQLFENCRRPAFPELRALKDLSTDEDLAEAIIRIADSFYLFNHKYVSFSGYGRIADAEDGSEACLYAQVWVDDRVRRSVVFRNVGYVGILHIDIPNDMGFHLGIGRDLIGNTYQKYGENPDKVLATVAGSKVEVSFEIRR